MSAGSCGNIFNIYFRFEHKSHERALFPKTFGVTWAVQAEFFFEMKSHFLASDLATVNVDLCLYI